MMPDLLMPTPVRKVLRDYQLEASTSIFAYFKRKKGNPLVVIPTAGGKSLIIADFISRAIKEYPETRITLVSHVSELLIQNAQELAEYDPNIRITFYSAKLGKKDLSGDVVMGTIQSMYKVGLKYPHAPALLLIDEAHLLSPEDDTMYRRFIDDLKIINPHLKVVGFTASPFRTNSGYLHKGTKKLFTDISYEIGIIDLINRGYLVPIITPQVQTRMDVRGVKVVGGDYVQSQLEKVVDTDALTRSCVKEIIEFGQDRKKWIVFTAGVTHCLHVRDEIRKYGISCEMVTGETPRDERNSIVTRYKHGDVRCLVNVAVYTTGFNVPQVDLMAFMRPTRSPVLYIQCLDKETEILTSHGWKGIGCISQGDCAATLDMKTGKGKWSRILNYFERDMMADESWVEYNAPRANFRVTGGHDLIISTKKHNGTRTPFRKVSALSAALHKDGFLMPTSVEIEQPGIPLTDAEIYFIGIVMTDGSISSHQVTIHQSERYMDIIERIEKCLKDCGMRYRKYHQVIKNGLYKENFKRWRFSICVGKPRDGGADIGCRHLLPYLDKDLSPALMSMSKSQFLILIQGMWDGDGFKQRGVNIDYTPRSWKICSSRKTAIERLQILATIHGFTGHLRWEHKGRKNPFGIITISPQNWRSVGGVGNRPQVTISPSTQEKVWCVETETKTIITRRRGKVTVMGNCAGRGMRIHPNKHDCLLLDFGQVVQSLGPIDQIHIKEKKKSGGEAPIKICPKCHAECHAAAMECQTCGYEFPPRELDIEKTASSAAVLSTQLQTETHDVMSVFYYRHIKEGRPDSLRIEYYCGPTKSFRQWVLLETTGRQREDACFWWRQHASTQPPNTITEALSRTMELKKPKSIDVRRVGKYFNIVKEHL